MTNREQIVHSLLPRVEGLLLGSIAGLDIENLNREGAAKTLTAAIAILHKVRLLLDVQPSNEPESHLSSKPDVGRSLPDEVTIKAQARDYAKTSDDDSSYNVQKKQAFEAGVKWLADLLMNDVRQ